MRSAQAQTAASTFGAAGPITQQRYRKFHWVDILNRILVILLGLFLLFCLILIKSKTTAAFSAEPFLYIYTLFVTTFVLSRIASAMLFEKSQQLELASNFVPTASNAYKPSVTFVIPCKNEQEAIAHTIAQCYSVPYPKNKVEIIVINDGSTDDTIGILRKVQDILPNLKVVDWKENRGKRQGMIEGFRKAKGEIVIQLDSDSYIDPATFGNLLLPFQNEEITAVCAHADPQNADKNWITRMQAAYYFVSFRILKAGESAYQTVFCCSGCSSAYRKSAVLPVLDAWLHENFLGLPVTWGEDRALTSHLLKRGGKTIYTDQVQAYTIVPENLKQLLKQQLRWKKSWIINSLLTSRFIWRKQPFVAFLYYLPLVLVSFLTPFVTARAVIYLPLVEGVWPLYHTIGVLIITALLATYYRVINGNNKYWPYLFVWSLFSLFILSFVMFYAVIKLQDRTWGTR